MLTLATRSRNEIRLTKSRSDTSTQTTKAAETYEGAIARAKTDGGRVMLVFGAGWCVWCQKMESEALSSSRVKSKMDELRVSRLKVDVEKSKELALRYGVKSIPSVVLVDGEERVIKRHDEYMGVREMLSWLN